MLDLGPEGGDAGGEIVAQGTPEEVAETEGSQTGEYLRRVLPVYESEREAERVSCARASGPSRHARAGHGLSIPDAEGRVLLDRTHHAERGAVLLAAGRRRRAGRDGRGGLRRAS